MSWDSGISLMCWVISGIAHDQLMVCRCKICCVLSLLLVFGVMFKSCLLKNGSNCENSSWKEFSTVLSLLNRPVANVLKTTLKLQETKIIMVSHVATHVTGYSGISICVYMGFSTDGHFFLMNAEPINTSSSNKSNQRSPLACSMPSLALLIHVLFFLKKHIQPLTHTQMYLLQYLCSFPLPWKNKKWN